jgi:hypothetical protein
VRSEARFSQFLPLLHFSVYYFLLSLRFLQSYGCRIYTTYPSPSQSQNILRTSFSRNTKVYIEQKSYRMFRRIDFIKSIYRLTIYTFLYLLHSLISISPNHFIYLPKQYSLSQWLRNLDILCWNEDREDHKLQYAVFSYDIGLSSFSIIPWLLQFSCALKIKAVCIEIVNSYNWLFCFLVQREVSILLPLESSGYQKQDGIKHPQQYSHFSYLGGTQMLLRILQGAKASKNAIWSFWPIEFIILWSVKAIMA